ncbi:MAG: UDP-N-acetylmuramoyl-L-alanyl-D-glutamate--2,6-diaminopimelate ligase [Acidobacteria bacterium]|nr:UDP-N-acetylmuramoyl-L-alanyl-D-glutamate--2,6-diaminopimelate ligase [Acidobacteriota bacterium]
MTFQQLLDGAEVLSQTGDVGVRGLDYDSRRIKQGDVFIAIRGEVSDGNEYIDAALARGAVAIVTDSSRQRPRTGIAWAQVRDARRALGRLSANLFKRPAEKLSISGITGTNGKSTSAFLLESMLRAAGRKTALVGTIEYHVGDKILPAPHTTPESLELNHLLRDALREGVTEVVMEVSSHALVQQRVFAIPFDVAIFTNLTRDHLDYHQTIEGYFAAKQILFVGDGTEAPRLAVLNVDDQNGDKLRKVSESRGSRVLTYGWSRGDFHAQNVRIAPRGTYLDMVSPEETIPVCSPLIGRVNVYNILAAAAAAYARGCHVNALAEGIGKLARVPGRFERVDCGQPFTLVVDYAHTDDALRNLTSLAREFVSHAGLAGRVITLFGCGGDRDRSKRPLMGEAAGGGSDFVVLTSDNPRTEDPGEIISQALVGLKPTGTPYVIEPDRRNAIALAVREAKSGDIVLLAGKGHEKVQVSREGAMPFDDVSVARDTLAEAGYVGVARMEAERPS